MIVKKNSDHEIRLFIDTDSEIESFTLLKLTLGEFRQFLNLTPNWVQKHNYLQYNFKNGDPVDTLFKKLANDHKKANPEFFKDVSIKYESLIKGTRCLLRDPTNHIIKIAKVKNGDYRCNINKCIITNQIANEFFKQVVHCKLHKEQNNYAMDTRDLEKYQFWSRLMNNYYFVNIAKQEKKESK